MSARRTEKHLPRTATLITSPSREKYVSSSGGDETVQAGLRHRSGLLALVLPETYQTLERTLTIPRTTTYNSLHVPESRVCRAPGLTKDAQGGGWSKAVPWLKFDGLKVGRNSNFNTDALTDDQLEEIGGTEYRALKFLSYYIPAYFFGTQILSFIIFAPYLISTSRYDSVFEAQPRLVPKAWFSVFQILSSYTGCGLSLVDEGMVPFQEMYPMILSIGFIIIAGKHGLPIFLRFIIWLCAKMVPQDSPISETLHFLLDHPRRCCIYLFPSHQTWFLFGILVTFSAIEWSCFWVLDNGLSVTESLPIGIRLLCGLFQGIAARASGFAIVNISALAPSVTFLYVIMMYIAIYPIAISIRSTNVYEERSLGIYGAPPDRIDEEPELEGSRRERIGKYLGWHLRRQLANDIWWVVGGVWLICIIERGMLMNPENASWFNIFRIVFELVSAFSGIGLSLGIPTENYSFVGAFNTLSKLVVIVIMVRGRQRELPLSIDRAIMLPHEFQRLGNTDANKAERESSPDPGMPRSTTV